MLTISEIFKNSFRFALSDKYAILILGIILTFISYIQNLSLDRYPLLLIVIELIIIILSLLEMGYAFRIIEETILKKSSHPPLFNYYKNLLIHGIKDSLVYLFYGSIMFFIVVIVSELISLYSNYSLLFIGIGMILISFIFLFLIVAIINLACHHGNIRYGFEFREINRLLVKIGYSKIIIICLLNIITESLLFFGFSYAGILTNLDLVYIILELFINPFLILFSERAIALSVL